MLKYTLKRLFQSLITVLLVISVVFLLLRMLPTDYFFTEEQLIKLTDEQQEDLLRKNGYLDPPLVQLANFYKELIKTEHNAHYYDLVNLIDDSTFEVTLKSAKDAESVKAEDIQFARVEGVNENYPLVKATAVATDAARPGVVIITTDNPVQKKVAYEVTCGNHTGTFTVRKEGKEVAVKNEKTTGKLFTV